MEFSAGKTRIFDAVSVNIVLVICMLYAPPFCIGLQLTLKVSQLNGSDEPSCLVRNAVHPCKSLEYALASLQNSTRSRGTLMYHIITLDRTYLLEKQLQILQPDEKVSLSVASKEGKDTVLHCISPEAGVTIGSQFVPVPVTFARNINFKRLRFQNCGPKYGASVLVWNSQNISFSSCSFRDNLSAGLNVFDSSLSIDRCLFVNNTSNAKTRQVIFQPGIFSAGGGLGALFIHAINRSIIITLSEFFSNTALFNNTEFYISPSSNMSSFYNTGGGVLVAFLHNSEHNSVVLENSTFVNNSATYGGGVYYSFSETAADNRAVITGGILRENRGAQAGGAIAVSQWDRSRRSTAIVRNSTITHNWARRGGGVDAFFMNNLETPGDSALKFDRVQFLSNTGRGSTAVLLTSALPLGYPIASVPEFINCTIIDHKRHDKKTASVSSPFTSFRVDARFSGHNIFASNRGSGAMQMQNGIIHVEGKLELSNNTGYKGAGMWLTLSQIKLYPHSELLFIGNVAASNGGALCADTFRAHEVIHEYNTDCFLTYVHSKSHTPPPSKWKTKVSFIRNSAGLNGAAVFATSLESCLWTEKYPYHSYTDALRWNDKFEYKMNYLLINNKEIGGWKYDIATNTVNFRIGGNYSIPFMLSPGENVTLNIKGVDQLNNTVHTVASLSELSSSLFVGDWILDNTVQVLDPFYNRNLPFMYRVESRSKYDDLMKSPITHKLAVRDIYSSESNRFVFEVKSVPCRPGFRFVDQECRCNKAKQGVLRCKGARDVFLEEGYWGGVENGQLVTYFCPYKYCNCVRNGDLPGCMFDSSNPDSQCNPGREGHLCGRCKGNLSVGLRSYECLDCREAGWFLAVVVAAVVLLCIFIIWLNMGISNDLRGPLFVFQMLPFIFEPRNSVGDVVTAVSDILHFGGPFVFVFKTCAVDGMNNLYDVALGYVMPFVTLGVFVISYILSANYFIRLKFRRNSPLQSFWLIMLFMYTYLVETSFLLHHCPKVGNQHVFFYDGNVKCYQGNHLVMVIIASFVLALFVIPPPVIVVMLTTGIWKVDSQYVNTLTNGLNRGRLWWWVVDLGRRVLIIATFVFVPDWLTRQVLMVLVCIFILAVHSNLQPYKVQRINTTETLYLVVLATLATLQLLNEKDVQTMVSAIILALIVLHTVMLAIYKGFRFFRKRFCTQGRLITNKSTVKYGAIEAIGHEVDPEVRIKSAIFDAIFGNANDNSLFDKVATENG